MATIKIQVLDSLVGTDFTYPKGLIVDAPEERAKELVRAGLAILVDPPKQAFESPEAAAPQKETRKKK